MYLTRKHQVRMTLVKSQGNTTQRLDELIKIYKYVKNDFMDKATSIRHFATTSI